MLSFFLRQLFAIVVLPFTVVVLVPRWIFMSGQPEAPLFMGETAALTAKFAGPVIFAAGLAFFAWCVSLFGRRGKGTLAPWDPPRDFVAVGPYRHVRNPMISGVCAMLLGEALFLNSRPIATWFLIFLLMNQLLFMLVEEPGLERRFGEEYRRYKAAVPRWIPRFRV